MVRTYLPLSWRLTELDPLNWRRSGSAPLESDPVRADALLLACLAQLPGHSPLLPIELWVPVVALPAAVVALSVGESDRLPSLDLITDPVPHILALGLSCDLRPDAEEVPLLLLYCWLDPGPFEDSPLTLEVSLAIPVLDQGAHIWDGAGLKDPPTLGRSAACAPPAPSLCPDQGLDLAVLPVAGPVPVPPEGALAPPFLGDPATESCDSCNGRCDSCDAELPLTL